MEVRLLGPLEVLADGVPLSLGGKQRRTLLAILAVNAGRAVSTDRLIDELWGESPPDAARKSVQAHTAHLRRTLNFDGEILAPTDSGYILQVEPETLDIGRFEHLFEEGRRLLQADPTAAIEKLDEALALFRGAPLAGLADHAHSLRVEASRIEELRLAAIEERLEAQIRTGDAIGAAAESERLVAEHPLRERLWGLLMLSLNVSGRQGEALRAFSRARRALAEELGIEPSAALRELEQRILDQDPTLQEASSEITSKPAVGGVVRNPYKGLRAFGETDAADFFGRDDLIRRLIERVESRTNPLVVFLAGPSGAGKSSAVRAGLIPELRERRHQVALMFPGSDPLTAMAKTIAEATDGSPAELLDWIQEGDPVRFEGVLIVDQFEEVFTMVDSKEDVDIFLDVIVGDETSVRFVVATIRADFLDHLLAHPRTGPILEEALVLVPPLQEHEIEAAVVGPPARVGVAVDSELVARIITDVQTRSASLPLLQFALTDTFERRRGDRLTLADYERAGGITGALARRADELYETLDHEHQEAARQMLLHLVAITEEGETVRRRVTRETLLGLRDDVAEMSKVMERFGSLRLLTFDQDFETGLATVEVAHEALISEWPLLARWVEDRREDLRLRQRLAVAANEWVQSERDAGYLLADSRLDQLAGWATRADLELAAIEKEYLEASRAERRRADRNRRVVGVIVTLALVVASGLGVLLISQDRAAEEQARIVRAGDLAAAANVNLDVDPELSILLALEAVTTTQKSDGTVLRVAEQALHRAVLSDRLLGRVSHQGEGIAHFSPDGMSFLTSGENPLVVDVWRVDPFQRGYTLIGHTDVVFDAVFDPSGDRIATTSLDGTVRVWDSANGQIEIVLPVGGPALVPAFGNDGSLLAATAFDGTTRVWDLETEKEIWAAVPPGGITVNLAFSPDDSLLAVTRVSDGVADDLSALIYDVATGGLVRKLEGHEARDVGFTPDGSRLLTAGGDGTVRIWDTGSGEHLDTYTGHRGPVSDLQVSADGITVASSGAVDVRVWDLSTFELEAEMFGHTGEVWAIDLNPDADLLLTATKADGTTRLWDLSSYWSHELIGLPGSRGTSGLAYSPDGATLAASGEAGLVSVWDVIAAKARHAFETGGQVYRLDIDPSGRFLATAGVAGAEVHNLSRREDVTPLVSGIETFDVDFGSNGLLSTASFDGVRLWESLEGSGELISDPDLGAVSVAFDPGGTVLAMSLAEEPLQGSVEIRDLNSGETISTLTEHSPNLVQGLTFDSTGDLLVTASDDTTAIIWDATTFEPVHRLEGHTAAVVSSDFNPNRPEVATASLDGTMKIWNVEKGDLRLTLPAQGAVSDVAYSPNGRYLAATGPEGFVTVYMLDIDELVAEAQSRLTRWWSEAECLQYLQTEECPPAPEGLHQ